MTKQVRVRNKARRAVGGGQAPDRIGPGRPDDLPRAGLPAPPAVDEGQAQAGADFDDSQGPSGPDDVGASWRANLDDDVEALHEGRAEGAP